MARRSRKTQRRQRRRQNGGGWGFDGPAFAPAGGMAPESARALTDDCAVLERPAPSVTPTGAWSQAGGACGSCAVMAPPMVGGAWPFNMFTKKENGENPSSSSTDVSEPLPTLNELPVEGNSPLPPLAGGRRKSRKQRGGGGGGGGYGFQLNNDLGKVYASLPVGPCPSTPQRGGAATGTVSLGDASLVSYPAGYGYSPSSAMEVNNGTAHFLAQQPYGKHCMGGGGRTRKNKKSHRKSHRKSHH